MGIKLSLETYKARSAGEGRTYRISVDALSSQHHAYITTYEGMKYIEKYYDEMVIAKFQRQSSSSSEKWANTQVKISLKASEIAEKFNGVLRGLEKRNGRHIGDISFVDVLLAEIDEEASFHKRRKCGEFYTCESKLKNFKHFIDSKGAPTHCLRVRCCRRRSSSARRRSASLSSCSSVGRREQRDVLPRQRSVEPPPYISPHPPSYEQSQAEHESKLRGNGLIIPDLISNPEISYPACNIRARLWGSAPEMGVPAIELQRSASLCSASSPHEDLNSPSHVDWNSPLEGHILEAFVHYFYCHTDGQCVISNLKGEVDRDFKYNLTTPVFHSLSESFGKRDRGEKGISLVIENHKCNSLCRNFVPMKELFERAAERIV